MRLQVYGTNSVGLSECDAGNGAVESRRAGRAPARAGGAQHEDDSNTLLTRIKVKDCDKDLYQKKPPEPSRIDKPYKVVRCSCRCRFCDDCAVGIGLSLRQKLIPTIAKWHGVLMLSLTINPANYASPEEAYRDVRERRLVSRLVRELKRKGLLNSKQFFSVIEFQKNGWPHWHVLVDSNWIAFETVGEIWNRWGRGVSDDPKNPSLGFVSLSGSKFRNPEHAARYATKYLIKAPENGWPNWVLDFKGQIHRSSRSHRLFKHLETTTGTIYSHCGGCFCETCREQIDAVDPCECDSCTKVVTKPEETPAESNPEDEKRKQRTVRERLADCGNSTVILKRTYREVAPGRLKCEFMCQVDVPFSDVCKLFDEPNASQLFLDHAELNQILTHSFERTQRNKMSRRQDLNDHKTKRLMELATDYFEAFEDQDARLAKRTLKAIRNIVRPYVSNSVALDDEELEQSHADWYRELSFAIDRRNPERVLFAVEGLRECIKSGQWRETFKTSRPVLISIRFTDDDDEEGFLDEKRA